MSPRPAAVILALATLYFGPGLLFFYVAEGRDAAEATSFSAVLTAPDEPGEPLLVTGTVYRSDGKTPAAGVQLYAYHTDAQGLYSETNDNTNPRLHATVRTNAEGRYELRTIKPAPYPGGGVPAHIHYRVFEDDTSGEGSAEQRFDLHFAGDPYLSESAKRRSTQQGLFGSVQPLTAEVSGGWSCIYDLRLEP